MRRTDADRDAEGAGPGVEDREPDADAARAPEVHAALMAIKRELAVLVLFAIAGAPLVMYWLEGAREWAVLAAYGAGAGLWIHARARGVLVVSRRARRGRGDGA